MSLLRALRARLGIKLFLSHLVIVVVGVLVLAVTAVLQAPDALARHIAQMEAMVGSDPALAADLVETFLQAVAEVLLVAALAALVAAVAVSTFVARRIVGPIQAMTRASRRIADGDYHHRLQPLGEDELGALAEAFNRMAARLESTERRRMALIGDVAHELRTPLASLAALLEGVVDGVLPAEPATLAEAQRELLRLQRLVSDLEELSRAEAGQIPLQRRPTRVHELVEAAVSRLAPQFDEKGVTIRDETPENLPAVDVDPERVLQVLLNLLGNALQYTPAGGEVRVTAERQGDQVRLAVVDTGIGIPAEHLPHIFERFYRVDKSRSRAGGGSGVGLTIARHLVEAHGGRIGAESAGPGRGSTFWFTLPLAT